MSVIVEPTVIRLVGRCLADDAEALLTALHDHPQRPVDIAGVQKLHLAVVQVLLSARRTVIGQPDSPALAKYVLELLQ